MKLVTTMPAKFVLFIFCLFAMVKIQAQKLPNVQKVSIWPPADIKVDGKADEWNDKYQAYNNATDIFYTLSNDEQNIYLTIKIKDHSVMGKIIKGGISFTVNHTLKKKDDTPITITYPALNRVDRNAISNVLISRIGVHRDVEGIDNSLEGLNKLLATKSKYINIRGIKDIPDDDISVYNDNGIKAVSKFDKPLIYIYELAVPLKYLDLPKNGSDGFSYHIKMNAEDERAAINVPRPISHIGSGLPPPPPPAEESVATTDFWGEYILAKKP